METVTRATAAEFAAIVEGRSHLTGRAPSALLVALRSMVEGDVLRISHPHELTGRSRSCKTQLGVLLRGQRCGIKLTTVHDGVGDLLVKRVISG